MEENRLKALERKRKREESMGNQDMNENEVNLRREMEVQQEIKKLKVDNPYESRDNEIDEDEIIDLKEDDLEDDYPNPSYQDYSDNE